MVPIEPNETMVITAHGDEHCGHVYDAMIGAALPPPSADRNNIEAVRLADDAAQKARQAASRLDPGSEKDVTPGLAHDLGHAALKWAVLQREHDRRLLKGLKDAALALARDASSQTGCSPVAQIESPPLMSDRGTSEAFKKAFLRELKRFWPDISQGAASKCVNEYVDASGIRKHGLSAPAAIELAHQFAYGFKE
jgi:hypothetical protein